MDGWMIWIDDLLCSTDVYVCLSVVFSDLDRDFWNNNDNSSVQQRWSSYPPKEFVLNISPYAPYGDPRLTLKWVSGQAGKRHHPIHSLPNTSHTRSQSSDSIYTLTYILLNFVPIQIVSDFLFAHAC